MVDRELRTLDRWRRKLSRLPQTIECSGIRLVGRDHEPDFFSGPGRIEIKSATEIRFYIYATAADGEGAFRNLQSAKQNGTPGRRKLAD